MADTFRKWIAGDKGTKDRDWSKPAIVIAAALPAFLERAVAVWQWAAAQAAPQPMLYPRIANFMILIFITFLVASRDPLLDEKNYPEESLAVKRFRNFWICFWLIFLLVYLLRTLCDWRYPSLSEVLRNFADNLLSNLVTLMLFLCYVVLAGYRLTGYVVGGVLALVMLTVLEGVVVYESSKASAGLQLWIVLFWQIFLGTLDCTIFALVFGRLESKIIKPPLAIMFALYFYAGLQPLAQALGAARPLMLFYDQQLVHAFILQVHAWLIFVSGLLKILMFVLVYWLLDSGVLLFYFNWLHRASTQALDKLRSDFVFDVRSRDSRGRE